MIPFGASVPRLPLILPARSIHDSPGASAAYVREGENAAQALRAAGASRIYLVGEPGTRSGQLRPAGVDAFIFAGCDALSILRAAHSVDASIR